jgi:2-polyprenyl-3-methyl-5-hydroxy-6-metoxy-1,4-benzoquinol methylase
MLPRVLEPEIMDTAQEAIDYDSMDHAAVNRLFETDLLFAALDAGLPVAERGRESFSTTVKRPPKVDGSKKTPDPLGAAQGFVEILDLGTGTAQIPIELCRRAPNVRVVAIDLAAEMLHVAKLNVELASLRDRVMLNLVDAKQIPYDSGRFDAIMSNSIVHHIPEPASVLAEAVRVVRPGGLIFIRDLLRPVSEAEVRRLVALYAADCNDHQRSMFDASLRAALMLAEIRALVAALGFPAETVRQTSDRHWTWSAIALTASQ